MQLAFNIFIFIKGPEPEKKNFFAMLTNSTGWLMVFVETYFSFILIRYFTLKHPIERIRTSFKPLLIMMIGWYLLSGLGLLSNVSRYHRLSFAFVYFCAYMEMMLILFRTERNLQLVYFHPCPGAVLLPRDLQCWDGHI